MKKLRLLSLILFLALPAGLLAACGEEAAPVSDIAVEIASPTTGDLILTNRFIGTITATEEVSVIPQMAAEIEAVCVRLGDEVNAGQVLCRLDDDSAQLQLSNAQLAYQMARQSAEQATGTSWQLQTLSSQANIEQLRLTIANYYQLLDDAIEARDDYQDDLDDLDDEEDDYEDEADRYARLYANASRDYATALAVEAQVGGTLDELSISSTASLAAAANADFYGSDCYPTYASLDQALQDPGAAATLMAGSQAIYAYAILAQAGMSVEDISPSALQLLQQTADSYGSYSGNLSAAGSAISSSRASLEAAIQQYDSTITGYRNTIATYEAQLAAAEQALAVTNGPVYEETKEQLDTQLRSAALGVSSAQLALDYYTLKAPISGTVTAVNVDEHNFAAPGYAAFTISNDNTMTVSFKVSEAVRNTLRAGADVTVSRNQTDYAAVLTEIGNSADPTSGLFTVKATVYATGEQLPTGVSVTVTADTYGAHDALLLPYDAVYYDNGAAYVYCCRDGVAHKTPIETGLFNDSSIVVLSGLTTGDRVVVTWSPRLRDGAAIRDVNAPPADSAAPNAANDASETAE